MLLANQIKEMFIVIILVVFLIFIVPVLDHWNKSVVDTHTRHSDSDPTKSLLILLNAVCLAEIQQVPILLSLI